MSNAVTSPQQMRELGVNGSKRHSPYAMATIGVVALEIVLLVAGNDLVISLLASGAIFFGLCSIAVAGGVKRLFGCLNLILLLRGILIGIILKIFSGEAIDDTLTAPAQTFEVFFLGYLGLLCATVCLKATVGTGEKSQRKWQLQPAALLSLTIFIMALGFIGWIVGLLPSFESDETASGGILGIARYMGQIRAISVVTAILYLNSTGSRRVFSHPFVLSVMFLCVFVGIFSTSKQTVAEPIVYYLLCYVVRNGIGSFRIWFASALMIVLYVMIIFPYSQASKMTSRFGDFSDRVDGTYSMVEQLVIDSAYRSQMLTYAVSLVTIDGGRHYFGSEYLVPFGRLAIFYEADRLIGQTYYGNDFSGWKTLTWGFELALPHFLDPEKPIYGAGNFLGHVAGIADVNDEDTQYSFGVMANAYNAFGMAGAFFVTTTFFMLFYRYFSLFWGDPRAGDFYYVVGIGLLHHAIVEYSISGLIALVWLPIMVAGLAWLARRKVFLIFFGPIANASVARNAGNGRLKNRRSAASVSAQ